MPKESESSNSNNIWEMLKDSGQEEDFDAELSEIQDNSRGDMNDNVQGLLTRISPVTISPPGSPCPCDAQLIEELEKENEDSDAERDDPRYKELVAEIFCETDDDEEFLGFTEEECQIKSPPKMRYTNLQQLCVVNYSFFPIPIAELKECFEQFGPVLDVHILELTKLDEEEVFLRNPNYGYIVFEDKESVAKALKARPIYLQGTVLAIDKRRCQNVITMQASISKRGGRRRKGGRRKLYARKR